MLRIRPSSKRTDTRFPKRRSSDRYVGRSGPAMAAFLSKSREVRILLVQRERNGMIGRNGGEAGAENRGWTSGKDFQSINAGDALIQLECELKADALADPVFLHQLHLFRPVIQRFQAVEQLIGKI